MRNIKKQDVIRCSFCGYEGPKLIGDNGKYICHQCVKRIRLDMTRKEKA